MRISDWSSDVCSSDLPIALIRSAKPAVGRMIRDIDERRNRFREDRAVFQDKRRDVALGVDVGEWPSVEMTPSEMIDQLHLIGQPRFCQGTDRKSTRMNSSH